MKHEIKNSSEISVVQAIVRERDFLCAESDYRKNGTPAGYWALMLMSSVKCLRLVCWGILWGVN